MRTLSQEVSKYALKCIKEIKNESFAGKYKSYIKSFPALMITEGLLLALAFTLSKSNLNKKSTSDNSNDSSGDKEARKTVFLHVANWLKGRKILKSTNNVEKDYEKVLEELSNMDAVEYRLAFQEALKVSDWLRRLAEGMIEDKKKEGESS